MIERATEPLTSLHCVSETASAATLLHAQRAMLLGTIAGGYVHDLNNLLTVIAGSAQLADEALPAGHPAREYLDSISQAGTAAGAMAHRLLAFVRRQPITTGALDLRDLCTEGLPLLTRLLGSQVELSTRLAPDLWPVWADISQIEQILLNLLVNARDAMPDGGHVAICGQNVTLRDEGPAAPGQYVCLEVSDTGVGIDPAIRHRLFEPFFTSKPAGHGLGLTTCRHLVAELGGAISVESVLGRGTTFRVYLPRHKAGEAA